MKKQKASQNLLFFVLGAVFLLSFATGLMLSSVLGGGRATATTNTAIGTEASFSLEGYTKTSALGESDKSDSVQKNYQAADLLDYAYSSSLLQTAEWTDQLTGQAVLKIHYEASFENIENRSVYLFTTCTGHSFTEKTAIQNIVELLNYNDYVDVIMIGANNRISEITKASADAAAASMFSLSASDFEHLADGVDCLSVSGAVTSYTCDTSVETKALLIKNILEVYSTEDFDQYSTYVHGLGQDGTGTGVVEVLYDELTFDERGLFEFYEPGETYSSAAEFVLTFGAQRHASELFSLYYFTKYLAIITNERGLDFDTTVQAVFNSFDAFATASRNTDDNAFPSDVLYAKLAELIGVDLGSTAISRSVLSDDCQNALSKLAQYTNENRYIVLIPNDGEDSSIYTVNLSSYDPDDTTVSRMKNAMTYTLTMINPAKDESAATTFIENWLNEAAANANDGGKTMTIADFRGYNSNVYPYSSDFETTGALGVLYSVDNTATITTIVTSEFAITSTEAIEVINSGDSSTSFDYTVTVAKDPETGGTKVTIELSNLTDENNTESHAENNWGNTWSIDVLIPIELAENTNFCTDEYDFKEVNASETTVSVKRVRTISRGADNILGTETFTETATVASPKLYKYEASDTTTTTGETTTIGGTSTTTAEESATTTTEEPATITNPDTADEDWVMILILLGVAGLAFSLRQHFARH